MRYLSEEEVIELNQLIIQRFSPAEPIGVQQPESLNMTIEQPKQSVFEQELYPSIFEKAAILYIILCQKNIFLNANKRTALVATGLFLQLNNYYLDLTEDQKIDLTLLITTSELAFDKLKEIVSEELKNHSIKQNENENTDNN